jgi:hypothetical protein
VQEGPFSATIERAGRLGAKAERHPPFGKEFPMQLTQALTAVTAIISFGFVAAVILGMV